MGYSVCHPGKNCEDSPIELVQLPFIENGCPSIDLLVIHQVLMSFLSNFGQFQSPQVGIKSQLGLVNNRADHFLYNRPKPGLLNPPDDPFTLRTRLKEKTPSRCFCQSDPVASNIS